jgi:hypothetical protein
VADGHEPFQDPLPEERVTLGNPTAGRVADVEQRFWSEVMILVAPIFLFIWGAFALAGLTHGGTQFGAFLGIVWTVGAAGALWQPYVAVLRPDGSLRFRALTRNIATTADAVYRITVSGGIEEAARTSFTSMIARRRSAYSVGRPCLATFSNETPPSKGLKCSVLTAAYP